MSEDRLRNAEPEDRLRNAEPGDEEAGRNLGRNADVEAHRRLEQDDKEPKEELTEDEPDVEAHRNLGRNIGRNQL